MIAEAKPSGKEPVAYVAEKSPIVHVISVSGGKDSTATLLLALSRVPRDRLRAIFCDTGNEIDVTYRYLDDLEAHLGISIERLKADFSQEIAAKREFIARDQRTGRDKKTGRMWCLGKASGAMNPPSGGWRSAWSA